MIRRGHRIGGRTVDGIPLDFIFSQVGPWALIAGFVMLTLTGRIVSRSTVQRERELLEQRANDWKEAHALTEKARQIQAEQLDQILDAIKAIAPMRSP